MRKNRSFFGTPGMCCWCGYKAELKNKQIQEMNRFMHYYSRFKNHENSYKVGSAAASESVGICL